MTIEVKRRFSRRWSHDERLGLLFALIIDGLSAGVDRTGPGPIVQRPVAGAERGPGGYRALLVPFCRRRRS